MRTEDRGQRTENRAGQALVELAIFGSFFLLILGALLSYGLRYNFNQQAQMTAFRRALKIASDPEKGSASYMVYQERHIPDPMAMFGFGSTTPISAVASVTRDYMMDATPQDAASLQSSVMDIQTDRNTAGSQYIRRNYKTVAFRIERNVPKANLEKYKFIYGSLSASNDGSAWGSVNSTTLNDPIPYLQIIDSCSSEIVNYDACFMQAMMLVDTDFCHKRCTLNADAAECTTTCNQATNPPNQSDTTYDQNRGGAWYAANYTRDPYVFPVLERLFSLSPPDSKKSMGLQPGEDTDTTLQESIRRTETPAQITTTESAIWTNTLNRTLIHQDNLDAQGYEINHANPNDFVRVGSDAAPSVLSGSVDQTVTTGK